MSTERSHESAGGPGRLVRYLLLPAVVLSLAGCENLFEVRNPGQILDEDLNNRESMENIVTGMSSDYSAERDDIAFLVGRASDELAGSGSYTSTNLFGRGLLRPEDVNGFWNGTHRARFNAEDGLRRMQEVMGDDFQGHPLTARAHMFAALSNIQLGENFCRVAFDGSEAMDRTAAFERALGFIEDGIPHAQQAGTEQFEKAMIGARAQVHVGLGNWDAADAAADQIETEFVHAAIYSDNSGRERSVWWFETHNRFETSAFGTLAEQAWKEEGDPRVPQTDCSENPDACGGTEVGAGGVTIHIRQEKFPDPDSDIPVVSGKEMRLIQAEAALRRGEPDEALAQINEMRTLWDELDPIDPADVGSYTGATDFDASDPYWSLLDRERYLTLWLEGRRLWDLHRWDHPFLDGGMITLEPDGRRDSCVPIARSEILANPNISG